MDTATLRPWRIEGTDFFTVGDRDLKHAVIRDKGERWCAIVEIEDKEGEANAALIVQAVNAHDKMRGLLEEAQAALGDLVRAGSASDDEEQVYEDIKSFLREVAP